MTLFFVSNNKFAEDVKSLKEQMFEMYLNKYPKKYEDYEIVEVIRSSSRREGSEFFSDFVHTVKIPQKPGFYVLKGVTMNKREYKGFEKEVITI